MAILGELLATCVLVGACGAGSTDGPTLVADSGAAPAALVPVPVNAKLSQLPVGYVQCAGEWTSTTCNVAGDVVLAYGTAGSYITAEVQGPFDCHSANSLIGDPAPGTSKACFVPEAAMSRASVVRLHQRLRLHLRLRLRRAMWAPAGS